MMEAPKNQIATVANPFGGMQVATPAPGSNALTEVESSRAIAEIQTAVLMAKRFPRNQMEAMDRIMNSCTRPSLAEKAMYAYARGGTEITGPSIRLAEAIAKEWGNLDFGIRELEQRPGVSTVQAYCWDKETNTKQEKTFQVKHERSTKKGKYALEDGRDIYELVANQGARRLRACILGIIPADVIDTALEQCNTTLKTKISITPELITSILNNFATHKVTKEMIEKRIQRRMESILPAQVVSLGKIRNSLNDGMSVPADWFDITTPEPEIESKGDAIKEKLKAKAETAPEAQKPDQPTQTTLVDTQVETPKKSTTQAPTA
jgi:hypothetical protein